MIRWKYEEMIRCQDDKMAWWHGDMVASEAKVTKNVQNLPRIAKKMADIDKNCQKVATVDLSDKKFIKVATSCQKIAKFAQNCQRLPKHGKNCSKLPKYGKSCPKKLHKVATGYKKWPNNAKIGQKFKRWQKLPKHLTFDDICHKWRLPFDNLWHIKTFDTS